MKTIINPKNALITLFGLECICALINILFSFINVTPTISSSFYFLYRFIYIITCIALLYLPNEYITKITQKIGLWIILIYKGINIILYNILPLINPKNTFYSLFQNNFGDDASLYFGFYSAIISIITTTASLIFIWGFQIKKSYKIFITCLYFTPGLIAVIIPLVYAALHVHFPYQHLTLEIANAITFAIIIWLILKAHKEKTLNY